MTRVVAGSSPARGTRSASHTRWYWIMKEKFSIWVANYCDKIFSALPPATFAVHFLSCAVVGAPTGKTLPLRYCSGRLKVGHQVHNLDTRFESSGCTHCGVEKRLSRHPHKVKIVGSSPTSRNQEIIMISPFVLYFCIRHTQQIAL